MNNDRKPKHDNTSPGDDSKRGRLDYNEEMAAEIAVPAGGEKRREVKVRENAKRFTRSAGVATGWAGLVIAILSWFIWPVLLGITAAVVGFIAFRQGSRGLGIWSITLGLIAAGVYLILIPLYFIVT